MPPAKKPLDHLEADAVQDPDAPVAVKMWGQTFSVKPVHRWKASGLRALRESDIDTWAQKAMDAESYRRWAVKDPDIEEAGNFLDAWEAASDGEDVPNS